MLAALIFLTTPLLGGNLATINEDAISDQSFRQAVEALGHQGERLRSDFTSRKQYLDFMIDNKLLANAGRDSGMHLDPEFKAHLTVVVDQLVAQHYFRKQLSQLTSDRQLKAYFESNKSLFSNRKVRASHILFDVKDLKKAEEVLKKAQEPNADFAQLAKQNSIGPSAPRGGDLNFFGRGRMVKEFEAAAFETKKGKVHSKLVKTQFGYHVIKVTDVQEGTPADFANKKHEVRHRIERNLRLDLLSKLRSSSKIEINERNLRDLKL